MIRRYCNPEMSKVWSDENKMDKWLQVELAVCEAWAKMGVIPAEDMAKIHQASYKMERIDEIFKRTHHDVTAFLGAVAESLGPESRFIHMGLTSSDVMDTALSLQMLDALNIIQQDVAKLLEVLERQAVVHKHTMVMGRTHGVHAEPTTFGLKLAVWVAEMRRNADRLAQARQSIAVGKISGAVGTYASVPPEVERLACQRLELEPAPVSNQILQRDRHAHFMTTLAILAGTMEKMATEIRSLQRTEVLEAEEPFEEGQTGSSAMPHKRNPELCERICGLARVVRGYAMTSLENIALWHERDISHSSTERIIIPDACFLIDYMLGLLIYIIGKLQVYPERMRENVELTKGLVFSQRVLLALIEKGLTRQQAYALVQRNALQAWKERTPFLELLKADAEVTAQVPPSELEALFDYGYYLKHVDEAYKRLGLDGTRTEAEASQRAELRFR